MKESAATLSSLNYTPSDVYVHNLCAGDAMGLLYGHASSDVIKLIGQ